MIDIDELALNAAHGKLNLLLDSHFGNPAYISVQSSWPHMLEFCHELIAAVDADRSEQASALWVSASHLAEQQEIAIKGCCGVNLFVRTKPQEWDVPLFTHHAPTSPEGYMCVPSCAIKEAFIEGFNSVATYNDVVMNEVEVMYEKSCAADVEKAAMKENP